MSCVCQIEMDALLIGDLCNHPSVNVVLQYKHMYEFNFHDIFENVVKEVVIRIFDIRCLAASIKNQSPGDLLIDLSKDGKFVAVLSRYNYVIRLSKMLSIYRSLS